MRTRELVMTAGLLSSLALLASGLEKYTPAERKHWAFQKRSQPAVPAFNDVGAKAWVRGPIDAPSRPLDAASRPLDVASRALDTISRGAGLTRGKAIPALPGTPGPGPCGRRRSGRR